MLTLRWWFSDRWCRNLRLIAVFSRNHRSRDSHDNAHPYVHPANGTNIIMICSVEKLVTRDERGMNVESRSWTTARI